MTRVHSTRLPAAAAPKTETAKARAPAAAWLQPKLAIGAPGDAHEQEADAAADRVLQGGGRPALTPLRAPAIQRQDDEAKKKEPDPIGDGLGVVAANLGESNPAFGVFTEKLASDFMAHPPALSVGVPVFMGANYAFLWSMAMVNPAMRRNFDDFNLAMLPGLVPQFPVKTFTYRILDGQQTRFEFDFGLDASALLKAFNNGVLNTRLSSLKFDSSGRFGTAPGAAPLSLSAMQVRLGLFSDGINLSGGFRNGISPYPLIEPGGSVMAQTPAMPDLQAGRQDVRFALNLDLVRLYQHFNPGKPNPLGPQIDVSREARQPAQAPGARESSPAAAAAVQSTLAGSGTPLEPSTRQFMESRFGHDFGRVRVHADAQAAGSAQSVGARAYTVGSDLVFDRGQYAPATPTGRHLLAHELAHVVQQGGGAGLLQRQLTAKELDDFDTDDFAVKTLETYLATHGPGKIEDNNDSDDKARRIVRLWKNKQAPFVELSAQQKILLIQEMQSGYTGNDDERGILALLLNSPPGDLTAIFAAINPEELDSDFQGAEETVLRDFYDQQFTGGRKAALAGSRTLRRAKADEPAVKAPPADEPAQAPGPPRQDYVFIMGVDKRGEPFYSDAERFFRAHRPKAVFVTDKRSLAEVLRYVADKIKAPIGNLYLVSHANEDGTLMFGLDPRDPDHKLNATELRKALHPTEGNSALAKIGPQVDAYTVVRIKGCDLGRNGEMLDLLDEAFGGRGTVIAPTHEQTYGTDPDLGDRAGAQFARGDAAFNAKLDADHPEPPAVDKTLKGKALLEAQKARRDAVAKRKADIAAARKQHEAERSAATAKGLTFEGFSGPMFQHTGDAKFGVDELLPKLKVLYPHLSPDQRKSLADRLVKDDPRPEAEARVNTTYGQQGQRLYRHEFTEEGFEPADASEFLAAQRTMRGGVATGFKAGPLTSTLVEPKGKGGSPKRLYTVTGSLPDGGTMTYDIDSRVLPTLAELAATARASLNNPAKYEWTQERKHDAAGNTKLLVTAKRVIAYLHHVSLDASPHEHFTRPESDPAFHAKSTFAPPEAPAP
ncbi:DUF4157 domain-containing protein [Variovorax sp. OV329]|uniref:eCIS core domain-containing protein n=1 Tax=Variovorax sp. OV329 TaxID=1882825 RepID=UPI0008F20EF7|nr:DUF4157 domain-containing protein [Variovorax sp. OV329]SFL96519.1 protein of unknown function [Variovorax sp. OV329]